MDATMKAELLNRINPVWNNFVQHRYNLELKKAGYNDWVIPCPFHKERTASGHITLSNKKIDVPHFHCYGCGAHYNAIDFVMQMENLDFIEACKVLGGYVSMEITSAPKNPKHEAYKDLMTEHSRRYQRELQNQPDLLKYLKVERALTDAIISQFGIGAVPQNEYQFRNDITNISGRIAFPILEHKLPNEAKCLGMGYRTLKDKLPDWDKKADPKYKNDNTTTGDLDGVFEKKNTLYGYPFAIQAIRKMQYAIIVEGYLDVISLHQSGVVNTVGAMGTAFTETQMDILKQVTSNVIMFLDSDSSGMDNMIKFIPILLKKGFSVKIIRSEAGKDPADLCKKHSFNYAEIMSYILKNAEPAINTLTNYVLGDYERIVVKERTKALNTLLPVVQLCNAVEQTIFTDMIYKRLDLK